MPLPSLKSVEWVTTDCYGTLIDWEKGLVDACNKEAEKDGFSFEDEPFLARFMEVQAEIMAGSYELYAEVLRRTIVKVAVGLVILALVLLWALRRRRKGVRPDLPGAPSP